MVNKLDKKELLSVSKPYDLLTTIEIMLRLSVIIIIEEARLVEIRLIKW